MSSILDKIVSILTKMVPTIIEDWILQIDPLSKNFGVRAILPKKVTVRAREWRQGTQLNQGSEGACVGFAWTHFLLSAPKNPRYQPTASSGYTFAMKIYRAAQKIDQWIDNKSGTSILAGAKTLKSQGYISEYRWCFTVDDIRDTVIQIGPVVAGVKWNKFLSKPFRNGMANVYGDLEGGHAILIDAYYPKKKIGYKYYEVFRIKNSWGTNYGIKGSAYITRQDLQKLLDAGGEFCVGIKKKTPVVSSRGIIR